MPPPLPQSDLEEILTATAPLWPEVRNQRLFLTGGTGFFGTWLVESFLYINQSLDLNAEITVLTRDTEARLPHLRNLPGLTLLKGDIRTFPFPPGDFPYIIHAATAASAKQLAEAPGEMQSTILDGTGHVLNFAASANTRKLLFTSSGAVYGAQPPNLTHIPELHSCAPTTIYGQAKLAAEQLLPQAPCEAKIARCFAFLGPHLPLDTHFAAGNFLADALANRPISISSDGRALRSYLYPTDLIIWLWTLLFRAPSLHPYNVGSEDSVSIRDLAETIRTEVNPTIAINIAQPAQDQHASRYIPSTARARNELNLHQTVSLQEAIRRTAAWQRLK